MENPLHDVTPAATGPTELEPRSVADGRFHSCRWRSAPETGPAFHCTHRDVFPFAGTHGFSAEAWCPECTYYKPRRITRKREEVFDR